MLRAGERDRWCGQHSYSYHNSKLQPISENESYTQLQMVWPEHLLNAPPVARLPPGYALRTYQRGDEPRFYKVMELAGWPGWNEEKLRPWLARIPPESWFMVVYEAGREIVATPSVYARDAGTLAGDLCATAMALRQKGDVPCQR